jgi:hypothetical protein
MVLLSDDLFWIASEKIRDVRVLKMFVGERVVFYVTAADGIWKLLVESSAVRKQFELAC